jgi:hypothetical protein
MTDAEKLLQSGLVLNEAMKCGCDFCVEMLLSIDSDFLLVSTRFANIRKANPKLMFQILIEEWDRLKILQELPELYN